MVGAITSTAGLILHSRRVAASVILLTLPLSGLGCRATVPLPPDRKADEPALNPSAPLRTADSGGADVRARIVRAEQFQLLAPNGETRARLYTDGDGDTRFTMWSPDAPRIDLRTRSGDKAYFEVRNGETSTSIVWKRGRMPEVSIEGPGGLLKCQIEVLPDGRVCIHLFDAQSRAVKSLTLPETVE
jgi:hypothetical protein